MRTTKAIFVLAALFWGLNLCAQVTVPEPIAGWNYTKEYITQNLVYPEADLAQSNSGKVVIGIHTDAQGVATQYEV